jgi:peptidoglycan/LPS O-acetylase OafA/YrhL
MRHIPQLDGLRAVAILMVFATHAAHVPLLWTGVDLFFVLSGYLITGILLRLKQQAAGFFAPFYLRRARRILPPYFIFLIAAALLFHARWTALPWCALFSANVGLAFGKINDSVLTPLWSLAVEEQFYLLWPCVILFCSPRTLRRVALAVIILSPFLRAFATPLFSTHFPIYFLSPFRADSLCAGAFIAISEREIPHCIALHHSIAKRLALAAASAFVLLTALPSFRTGSNTVLFNSLGYSLIALFFAAALVLTLHLRQGPIHALLTSTPLRYLGRISYTFYLWHWAVLIFLSDHLHSSALIPILAFLATFAIAASSWHFIEAPILATPTSSARSYQPATPVAA